ncbi:MAG: V-type ATP synthase subunit D [Sphaerochaeta sp.]|jgi:V/A-type H+-transporting ATPase subunit D|nr:V-type ATP synthase subunit D [Sphaerochaeta sp.]MCH3919701.1 V-type ATP synthase subunit D [Sphaerochaeta sp.]MCI2076981.1 V-type ATP synthase subunit D [Sphaerochaeta sp.]MCI2105091.1 V-type ATP synthase subunit D [Sphaerochaeta sp.]MCI2127907.1 V-type ATP synthase subunit D [Sphaerochaeta sp.]
MAVKLTKNELKVQKDALKQFQRYLPTLQLKKQQLQLVIRQIEAQMEDLERKQRELIDGIQDWIAVYHENTAFREDLKLEHLVKVDTVVKTKGNIAGVTIPVFKELTFQPIVYDLNDYPLWVDKGLASLRDAARYDALVTVLQEQVFLLSKELRTTSQRVNLFEKVKIPEAKENIRRIGIYLGDQQTAAVVRGKIAKKKLVKVS